MIKKIFRGDDSFLIGSPFRIPQDIQRIQSNSKIGLGVGLAAGAGLTGISFLLNRNYLKKELELCEGDKKCEEEVKKKMRNSAIKHAIFGTLAGLGGAYIGYNHNTIAKKNFLKIYLANHLSSKKNIPFTKSFSMANKIVEILISRTGDDLFNYFHYDELRDMFLVYFKGYFNSLDDVINGIVDSYNRRKNDSLNFK